MRVVADTGILVRAAAKPVGPAREFLAFVRRGHAQLVLSPFLLEEVERVLHYPRLANRYCLSHAEIAAHLQLLRSVAEIVSPFEGKPIVPGDRDDDPVIYTALAGRADVLCTVDKHFFAPAVLSFCSRYGIRIQTDVDLVRELRARF